MKKSAFLLSVLLSAGAVFAAGGAASLVAKESKTGGFTYSDMTKFSFIRSCSENADERVCRCVLDYLQKQYSEDEYNKLDSDLQKGYGDEDFSSFISSAVKNCDLAYADSGPALSEEEANAFVDSLLKATKKKEYVANCSSGMKDILGNTEANKICGCMYKKYIGSKSLLVDVIMRNGALPDDNFWATDIVFDCIPEKMSPGIKKFMVNYLNQTGLPKTVAQCIVDGVAKEYSFKHLIKSAMENDNSINQAFILMGAKCLLEPDSPKKK